METLLHQTPLPLQHFNFSDIRALESIKMDSETGLAAAAQQFESLFLDIVIKSMRSANKVFSEGNYLSSSETEMHQDMLDHQWAIHMSENGGIGLASVVVDQLRANRSQNPVLAEASGILLPENPVPGILPAKTGRISPQREAHDLAVEKSGSKLPAFESPSDFLGKLLPMFRKLLMGTPFNPMVLAAQSALETGWGQKLIHLGDGSSSHNLFGIKAGADWRGDSVEVKTLEYVMNQPLTRKGKFRAYESFQASVEDYLSFISDQPRYKAALRSADNPQAYIAALQQAGYATDPDYAGKIRRIMNNPLFESHSQADPESEGNPL